MAKIITFKGKEKGDIAYYIAKTLACGDLHTVALIDDSCGKNLFEAVHRYADDNRYVIEKENLVFLKDIEVQKDFAEKFDYIIYYFGRNNSLQVDADFRFVISGCTASDIHTLSEVEDIDKSYLIMRDKIANNITEKDIIGKYGIDDEHFLGTLMLDEKDEIAYSNFSFNGRQRIKDLSADMQYAIVTLTALISGEDRKTIQKSYRKAKRTTRV